MLLKRLQVVGVVAASQDAAMHERMERLYPAIENFGKAGDVADVLDVETAFQKGVACAPGGNQFHAEFRQDACEIHQSSLIANAQEGSFDAVGGEELEGSA